MVFCILIPVFLVQDDRAAVRVHVDSDPDKETMDEEEGDGDYNPSSQAESLRQNLSYGRADGTSDAKTETCKIEICDL